MKKLLSILALVGSACLYAADDAAVIDGPNYAFTISAPKDWKLTSTKELQAAFYPADTSFEKSPVIMYARAADKEQLGISSVTELNRLDLKGIQKQHPSATSQKAGSLKTALGTEIPLYTFSGGGYGELAAYAEQPKNIIVFVLSADTDKQLEAARAAFDELLFSYVAVDPTANRSQKKQAPRK